MTGALTSQPPPCSHRSLQALDFTSLSQQPWLAAFSLREAPFLTSVPWSLGTVVYSWRASSFPSSLLLLSRLIVCDSLRLHRQSPPRLLKPWDSAREDTGVGCHFLLQGIFPTQGSNPGLLHYQVDSFH